MNRPQRDLLNAKNVYIGIDVHLKQWNVCIYQGGICRKTFQQSPSVEALMSHLQTYYGGMQYYSAYEAGFCGLHIHYALCEAGIHNVVFNPADIAQRDKDRKRKTDKVDARKIAMALARGELENILILPAWRIDDRNLLRIRNHCVDNVMRSKIRLRHFLHFNGIAIPDEFKAGHWSHAFIDWLKSLSIQDTTSSMQALAVAIDVLEGDMNQLKEINDKILELMSTDRYERDYRLLRTIPGIGPTTAFTLLLECGDISTFSSADKFCAFIGVVPDIDQSDTHNGRCGITRRRHRVLRYMLTEAAWRAIKIDPGLSKLYCKYCCRMAKQKSIVKIAHKLAKMIKFVLSNKEPYAPQNED